jgi:ADP-heptose:LPS heptosyltransferase
MHIACAVGCPTVCVFGNDRDGDGASPVRLWAPRSPNALILQTPTKCRVCIEHRFKNEACLVPGHPCLRDLTPDKAIAALQRALAMPRGMDVTVSAAPATPTPTAIVTESECR